MFLNPNSLRSFNFLKFKFTSLFAKAVPQTGAIAAFFVNIFDNFLIIRWLHALLRLLGIMTFVYRVENSNKLSPVNR